MNTLPFDPVLPTLAQLLDAPSMAAGFALPLRGQGLHVEGCEVERIKYRPRRNASISYRLALRDAGDGERLERRVAARLREGGVLQLAWWPHDRKLDAPRMLDDGAALSARWLPEVIEALDGPGAQLRSQRVDVVQYVPEQRLTARVALRWQRDGALRSATVYAKASREPDGATAHGILAALQATPAWRAGRLRTPAALLWQPQAQLHWQSAAPGIALLDHAQAARFAAPLGEQLAALHHAPVELARRLDGRALRARLAEVGQTLALVLPASQGELRRAVDALERGLRWLDGQPDATLHGDLHPRNVLVNGETLTLIDLDGARRAPALLELGSWCADGVYRAVLAGGPAQRDASAWAALLQGYARGGGSVPAAPALAWATAWQLLTQRAWRCVVNLKPGRFEIAPRLIALAAEWAQSPWAEAA
jgi:thiamine kinase-like enzyme